MTNRIFVLAAAVLAVVATTAAATEPKTQYPPYPDVWGRVLPGTAFERSYGASKSPLISCRKGECGARIKEYSDEDRKYLGLDIMSNPTGRVVVFYYPFGVEGEKEMVMDFFTGEVREAKEDESEFWWDRWQKNPSEFRKDTYPLKLGPNRQIRGASRVFLGNGGFCWDNLNDVLWRGTDKLKPRISKMLFTILDTPISRWQDDNCGFFHDPNRVIYRVESHFLGNLFLLDDGTFLAASDYLGVVIRFRPDLTSPSIKNRKLFLVNTSAIKKFEENGMNNLHKTNKMVFDLLTNLRKEALAFDHITNLRKETPQ